MSVQPDAGEYAGLVAALCSAAAIPVALVRLGYASQTPDAGGIQPQCHDVPLIDAGEDITGGDTNSARGALAHEVAHHELGHTRVRRARQAGGSSIVVACVAAWAAAAMGYRMLSVVLIFAALVTASALGHGARRQEYAADLRGAELLDAAGFPGRACVRACLAGTAAGDPLWYRAGGWLLSGHPLTSRRLARLQPGEAA